MLERIIMFMCCSQVLISELYDLQFSDYFDQSV